MHLNDRRICSTVYTRSIFWKPDIYWSLPCRYCLRVDGRMDANTGISRYVDVHSMCIVKQPNEIDLERNRLDVCIVGRKLKIIQNYRNAQRDCREIKSFQLRDIRDLLRMNTYQNSLFMLNSCWLLCFIEILCPPSLMLLYTTLRRENPTRKPVIVVSLFADASSFTSCVRT